MTKMLTLFGEDISKLKYNDLIRERKMQRYLYSKLRNMLKLDSYRLETLQRPTQVAKDKVVFLEIYLSHLEALTNEIDYWLAHRAEPTSNAKGGHKSKTAIRTQNSEKRKAVIAENARLYKWQKTLDRDDLLVSWDREKFMLIANDRGYQTEEAIIQGVGIELQLDRARAKAIVEKGRFTWGQVLCLGAMLEMTPKEFCDTFLAGYFTNQYGEYRADYKNISRTELLKSAVRPQVPLEQTDADIDARPLDNEEWLDD